MMIFKNLILFLMLISITVILLTGCASNKKPKNIPLSIVKKVITGLD